MKITKQTSYLDALPEVARYIGDHNKGEIQIVTDPEVINEIAENHRKKIKSTGIDEEVSSTGIVFEDEYITVVRDPVIFPSKKSGTYLRVFEHSAMSGASGVVILPIFNGLIYLRTVFRHSTRSWELELPRGSRPEGFNVIENVKQEIAQEIGLGVNHITELGIIYPNTGLLAGAVHVFLVTLNPGEPDPKPEDEEAFGSIVKLTPAELHEKIQTGEIHDSFTLSAILLAQCKGYLTVAESNRIYSKYQNNYNA